MLAARLTVGLVVSGAGTVRPSGFSAWHCLAALLVAGCSNGVTLTALQPRLISSQTELRLGPTDVGVAITAAARFENPGDGETHLQAFLLTRSAGRRLRRSPRAA